MKSKEVLPYPNKEIKSTSKPETWQTLEVIANELISGHIVLWQHHGVFVGKIEESEVIWPNGSSLPESGDRHLVRLRVFNDKKEYHFWRSGNIIKGRLRTDEKEGDETIVVDTSMLLRSVAAQQLKLLSADFAGSSSLKIKTRNYIGYNEIGQAGYVDSRFVEFI